MKWEILSSLKKSLMTYGNKEALISIDEQDIEKIINNKDIEIIYDIATKENNEDVSILTKKAVENAIKTNLDKLKKAHGIILNIIGADDLTLFAISEAVNILQNAVDDETNVIFGAVTNGSKDEIEIVIIIAK